MVQSLGLVYGENSIEIACILLEPNRVGVDRVQSQVEMLAAQEGLDVKQSSPPIGLEQCCCTRGLANHGRENSKWSFRVRYPTSNSDPKLPQLIKLEANSVAESTSRHPRPVSMCQKSFTNHKLSSFFVAPISYGLVVLK
ncbi:hypothetical protein V6N13_102530 [Hibiscus sabdariffa]